MEGNIVQDRSVPENRSALTPTKTKFQPSAPASYPVVAELHIQTHIQRSKKVYPDIISLAEFVEDKRDTRLVHDFATV